MLDKTVFFFLFVFLFGNSLEEGPFFASVHLEPCPEDGAVIQPPPVGRLQRHLTTLKKKQAVKTAKYELKPHRFDLKDYFLRFTLEQVFSTGGSGPASLGNTF